MWQLCIDVWPKSIKSFSKLSSNLASLNGDFMGCFAWCTFYKRLTKCRNCTKVPSLPFHLIWICERIWSPFNWKQLENEWMLFCYTHTQIQIHILHAEHFNYRPFVRTYYRLQCGVNSIEYNKCPNSVVIQRINIAFKIQVMP